MSHTKLLQLAAAVLILWKTTEAICQPSKNTSTAWTWRTTSYGDYCYAITEKTWKEAVNDCQGLSTPEVPSRLLHINNRAQWEDLKDVLITGKTYWTAGFNNMASSSSATWYWRNDSLSSSSESIGHERVPLSYLPDSSANSTGHCLAIQNDGWVHLPCSQLASIICQFGPCVHYLTLNGTSATIRSPNFPLDYPTNTVCKWFIDVGRGEAVLTFNHFELEGGRSCSYDSIQVSDRWSNFANRKTLCGQSLPETIKSTSRYMYILMETDDSDQYKGFLATVRSSEAPFVTTLEQTHGIVTTDDFPLNYGQNITHHWSIIVGVGNINLKFTDFDLQPGDSSDPSNCIYDSLTVRIGGPNGPILGDRSYCGSAFPNNNNISAAGGALHLTLKTDHTVVKTGFRAVFWSSSECVHVMSEGKGEISSQGYPSSFFGECTWYIDVLSGVAKISFNPFSGYVSTSSSCLISQLMVKDGRSEDLTDLAKFCGSTVRSNLTSSSRYLTIELSAQSSSYSSRRYRTLKASFRSTQNCSEIYRSSNGTVTSPNYPSHYDPFTDCTWLIDVLSGNATLKFNVLSVQSHSTCLYDKFEAYDGNTTNNPLIGTFCGSSIPPVITASSRYLLLRMVTNGEGQSRGFHADFWSSEVKCIMWGFTDVYSMHYNNTCYGLHKSKKSWNSARAYCEVRNSSLLTFDSDGTYNAIKKWIFDDLDLKNQHNTFIWTAGYRKVTNSSNWFWSTLSDGDIRIDPAILHWKPGQPDNDPYIYMKVDGLCDFGATRLSYFVCEEHTRVTPHGYISTSSCSPPPYPRNGVYSPSQVSYASETSVTYSCDELYQIIGNNIIMCNNGLWQGHVPICTAITTAAIETTSTIASPAACFPLPSIQHGELTPQRGIYDHGSRVSAVCSSGYKSKDNLTISCSNGQWQGSLPYCAKSVIDPQPTKPLSQQSTKSPSQQSTKSLSQQSTKSPSQQSTKILSQQSTKIPSQQSTKIPSQQSTKSPSQQSTKIPSQQSTKSPSQQSTKSPSQQDVKSKSDDTSSSKLLAGFIPVIIILILIIMGGSGIQVLRNRRVQKTNLLLMEMEDSELQYKT